MDTRFEFEMVWPEDYVRQLLFLTGAFMIRQITRRLTLIHKDLQLKSDAIENSLNAFDIVDSNGKFIYVNKSYLRMWRYDHKDEVIGTSPAGHCADPEIPGKIIAELKSNGFSDIEFKARRKDGSLFDVRMLARVAHDADGNEVYPTSSVDVTEKIEAEAALNEAVRLRDEFLSVASHELKTPLTTLILQAQIRQRQLEKNPDALPSAEQYQEVLRKELKQLTRMTRLIDDMLDVSRLRTGKLRLSRERVELCKLVTEVVERMKHQFEEFSVPLTLQTCYTAWVVADSVRIEQVITNLLTNALKYGDKKPVLCEVVKEGKEVTFKVTDQGKGISKEDQSRIFSRFARLADPNEVSGLGLGLAIARDIIEAHDGKILVNSEPGHGSTFMIKLPLASRHL